MASTTFVFSSGDLVVEVTVEEDSGNLDFTVEVVSGTVIGDLRGLFFDMDQDVGDGTGWSIINTSEITDSQIDEDSVIDLGNGANMQGVDDAPYDIGVEIGTQGIGEDDIQLASFTLTGPEALTLDDLGNIGVRLTSVGEVDGDREGSVKLTEMPPQPPSGAQEIFLVVEEEDAGAGLGGNEDTTSSPDEDDDIITDFSITTNVDSGILTFGAGSMALTSFVFSGVSNLTTETNGVAGQDLYWVLESDTQISGYTDALMTNEAVRLTLSAPASIDPFTNGDVTVNVELFDNLLHVDPGTNVEEVLDLGFVLVEASDGVFTVTGQVHIDELDDTPVADIQDGDGSVTIDETAGLQDGPVPTDPDRGAGADPDNDDVAGTAMLNGTALTTVFGGVSNPGSDGSDFEQYALSAAALVDTSGSSVGADSEGATTVISLEIADADSGLTTTDGKEIKLFLESGLIVGRYDDTTGLLGDVDGSDPAAFAIAIGQDGNVAVVQYVSLANPTFPNDFDEAVDLTGKVNAVVTVTDSDGDEATDSTPIGDQIFFQDDGPLADIANGSGSVTIDETAGLQDGPVPTDPDRGAGADPDNDDVLGSATLGGTALTTVFSGVSNPGSDGSDFEQYALSAAALVSIAGSDVGQDDEGATTVISLAINSSVTDGDSGLTTTDGKEIKLFLEGDLIVGRYDDTTGLLGDVDGSDPAAFAIAIDQDGFVAVVQYVSLANPTFPNDFDEAVDLTGKVDAVVTVTDGDLDVATDNVDIGDQIFFQDDGPLADIANGSGSVTIDETAGLQDGPVPTDPDRGAGADPDNDDVLGTAMLSGTALATVFGLNVTNQGSDTGFVQYALSASALVDTSGSDVGQDDEDATIVLSLAIVDADSELTTTDGKEIKLFKEGDLIVGRYDDTTGLLADVDGSDPAAFAIAIGQDGNVAIAQYVSLANPDSPTNFDESVDLSGKINAVVTVTDGDLDVATDFVAIGDQIFFQDDGPLLSGVDDSFNSLVFANGTTDTDSYSFSVGADNEDAPGITLEGYTDPDDAGDLAASGLDDLEALLGDITAVQSGNTVTYYTNGGSDELFELSVDNSGWSFDILQDAPIVFNSIDFQPFVSGGPVETISVVSDSGTTALFDGWLFSGGDGRVITNPSNPGAGSTDDDLNPDNIGFGVRGQQASNINNNEGFGITFSEGGSSKTVEGLQFSMDQQGNTDDVAVAFQLTNSGGSNPTLTSFDGASGEEVDVQEVGDGEFFLYTTLPGGNNDIIVTILPDSLIGTYVKQSNEIVIYIDGEFDDSLFKMTYPQDDTDRLSDPDAFYTEQPFENDSVRVKDVSLVEVAPIPDLTLSFDIQGTDGDGDQTQLDSFDVFITDDGGAIV